MLTGSLLSTSRPRWACELDGPHALARRPQFDFRCTVLPRFFLAFRPPPPPFLPAGVGKGRQIAAMIAEYMAQGGRRVLWVSVSTNLKFDAERDLKVSPLC